jgi:hypothetical protein
MLQPQMKLPAPAFAEAASRRQAQGGASGKCRYDYRVGFDSSPGVRFRPPSQPTADRQDGASSRLARDLNRPRQL